MKLALDSVFKGRTVTIIGGGPSLRGFDFGCVRQPVIACNYTVKYVPSEMFVCIDAPVVEKYNMKEFLDRYKGLKICMRDNLGARPDYVKVEISPNHEILDLDWHIEKVNLTGFLSIAIALYLGAELIYLLGFDGGYDDPSRPDWYPEAYVGPGQNTFHAQNGYYDFFTCEKIINVGRGSRIDSFPKTDLNTDFYKTNYHELQRNTFSRKRVET